MTTEPELIAPTATTDASATTSPDTSTRAATTTTASSSTTTSTTIPPAPVSGDFTTPFVKSSGVYIDGDSTSGSSPRSDRSFTVHCDGSGCAFGSQRFIDGHASGTLVEDGAAIGPNCPADWDLTFVFDLTLTTAVYGSAIVPARLSASTHETSPFYDIGTERCLGLDANLLFDEPLTQAGN